MAEEKVPESGMSKEQFARFLRFLGKQTDRIMDRFVESIRELQPVASRAQEAMPEVQAGQQSNVDPGFSRQVPGRPDPYSPPSTEAELLPLEVTKPKESPVPLANDTWEVPSFGDITEVPSGQTPEKSVEKPKPEDIPDLTYRSDAYSKPPASGMSRTPEPEPIPYLGTGEGEKPRWEDLAERKERVHARAREKGEARKERLAIRRGEDTDKIHDREFATSHQVDPHLSHKDDQSQMTDRLWSRQIEFDERVAYDIANIHRRLEWLVHSYMENIDSLTDNNV